MGNYRDDIAANYAVDRTSIGADQIKAAIANSNLATAAKAFLTKIVDTLTVVEDVLTQKAIARVLRQKQNLFQNRYRAAYEAYVAQYPDKPQMQINLDELEKIDAGITENWRQLYSNDQGTISGRARDAHDKIEQQLESIIGIMEK
jgi:hypothetical protein